MADPFHNAILLKSEEAAKLYLDANPYTVNPSLANYRGVGNPSLTTPRAVLIANNATSEMQDGTWDHDLEVQVISDANDGDNAAHRSMAAEVFARFMTASIAADLSAATTGYTAQRVIPDGQGEDRRGNEWVSSLKLKFKGVVGQSGV